MQKSKFTLRALSEGAIFVALAQILSMLKLFELPQGGSISLAMLPIFIYCARWGFGPGVLASFLFGLLHLILSGAYAWGWESILGDYLVAYTALGLAGLFHKNKNGYFVGILVGGLARFLVHYVVGATVWAMYMPETFFGMTMTTPWFYSLLYNGFYMVIDMVLCLVVFAILSKPMEKYLLAKDVRALQGADT